MILHFLKYQGTGNDFIVVDQRKEEFIHHNDNDLIRKLCDRRFGIGADGLILLESSHTTDFRMEYFNADGRKGSMCGNGGRCIIAFAHDLGIFQHETEFIAVDGKHQGKIYEDNTISIHMQDVHHIKMIDQDTFELNTGSPHFVSFCDQIPENIFIKGSEIRYSNAYKKEGINVNFAKILDKSTLEVATYERGVEDETLSCGTGVTAVALSYSHKCMLSGKQTINIKTKGGLLAISYQATGDGQFSDIWLTGTAKKVFEGEVCLKSLV